MINSKIEWCHHTLNLWWGCIEVHEGCDNCYAKKLAQRWGHSLWEKSSPRRLIKSSFKELAKYQAMAEKANETHRVFVGSMMDIFEKPMNLIDVESNTILGSTHDVRMKLFENISNGMYPNLIFLFLTKRPSNINKYIPESWKDNPPQNVMFGTSVVNQETAYKLIPQLLEVNGLRFLSVEPQLDDLSLIKWLPSGNIHWVIQGGESGNGRRPFNLEWGRKLKIECNLSNVPFFFKQVDKVLPIPEDLMVREFYNYGILTQLEKEVIYGK